MKKRVYISIFLFLPLLGLAQKEGNIWFFGDSAGVDFNSGGPVALTNMKGRATEAVASYCDTSGQLLFYTYGFYHSRDKNRNIMLNGTGPIDPAEATQCLIAPQPLNDSLVYVFYMHYEAGNFPPGADTFGLRYGIVNLNGNGGLGAVVVRDIRLFWPSPEKVTAVKHANGIDYWVITHEWNSDAFRVYKMTCNGLDTVPIISHSGSMYGPSTDGALGCLKPNHKGNFLASAQYEDHFMDLSYFDKVSGVVSHWLRLNFSINDIPYGIEFSPNDSLMYVSCPGWQEYLYQINLYAGPTSSDLLSTKVTLYNQPNPGVGVGHMGGLQLAVDNKIYLSRWYVDSLSVISDPNVLGPGCNFTINSLYLQGRKANGGLPHGYDFLPHPWQDTARYVYSDTCFGDSVHFSDVSDFRPDSSYWDFGDGLSSQLQHPAHLYASSGTFVVRRITWRSCLSDTLIKYITVLPDPVIDLGADRNICLGDTAQLLANPAKHYRWSTNDTTQLLIVNQAGSYWVNVQSGECESFDTIEIFLDSLPVSNLPADTTLCQGASLLLDAGNPGATYLWNTAETNSAITVNAPGIYSVQITNSCGLHSDTVNLTMDSLPQPDLGADMMLCGTEKAELSIAQANSTVSWYFSTDSLNYDSIASGSTLSASDSGWYRVRVLNSCGEGFDILHLQHDPDNSIQSSNIFSPNGDGQNDLASFEAKNKQDFQLRIFDRWGIIQFESTDPAQKWNGQYKEKEAPSSTYYYLLHARNCRNEEDDFKGWIELVR